MKRLFKYLFESDRKPVRGLLAAEWLVIGYTVLTLLLMLFMYTRIINPHAMISLRLQSTVIILALWLVYRLAPCRLTLFCRIGGLMLMLSQWYPDTYEFNRLLPNCDPLFAAADQQLFGFQPALVFATEWSHPVFSELMHLGYSSYYPLIGLVTLFYFFCRSEQFLRTAFIILGSFFAYYVVFIFLPVTGPQYYYLAVGLNNIAAGVFPDVGSYFATHQESLPIPGWTDGFFYDLVCFAHDAGERPTAAFPSSHVGVTTILLLLAWQSHNRRLLLTIVPFFLLMCLATVYIQAHYAIDVIGGLVTGVMIYAAMYLVYNRTAKH